MSDEQDENADDAGGTGSLYTHSERLYVSHGITRVETLIYSQLCCLGSKRHDVTLLETCREDLHATKAYAVGLQEPLSLVVRRLLLTCSHIL